MHLLSVFLSLKCSNLPLIYVIQINKDDCNIPIPFVNIRLDLIPL